MTNAVRLNEHSRSVIRERILRHAFHDREVALEAERNKVGSAIYYEAYPADILRKMRVLPDGFLPTDTSLEVEVEGERSTLTVYFGDRRVVAHHHRQHAPAMSCAKEHTLIVEYLRVKALIKGLVSERSLRTDEARGILNSVQSIAALAKAWPEAAPLFADFRATTPNGGALARDLRKLNNSLGLPPTVAPRAA